MKNYRFWVPLIEWKHNEQNLNWSGKVLPLPLDKKIKIEKKSISEGFNKLNSSYDWEFSQGKGLFCKIGGTTYLLGVNNIKKIESQINITPLEEQGNLNSDIRCIEENIYKKMKSELDYEFTRSKLKPEYTGLEIRMAGRLRGVNMARKVIEKQGSFKRQSLNCRMDYTSMPIYTKWGKIGLRVYLGYK